MKRWLPVKARINGKRRGADEMLCGCDEAAEDREEKSKKESKILNTLVRQIFRRLYEFAVLQRSNELPATIERGSVYGISRKAVIASKYLSFAHPSNSAFSPTNGEFSVYLCADGSGGCGLSTKALQDLTIAKETESRKIIIDRYGCAMLKVMTLLGTIPIFLSPQHPSIQAQINNPPATPKTKQPEPPHHHSRPSTLLPNPPLPPTKMLLPTSPNKPIPSTSSNLTRHPLQNPLLPTLRLHILQKQLINPFPIPIRTPQPLQIIPVTEIMPLTAFREEIYV